jgi:hypothetical protein
MKINFTRDEMASFLRKQGYDVLFEKRDVLFPTRYNNLHEKITIDTCGVFKNDKPYMYHLFDPEFPFQWLEMVFEEEMKNKLLNL